MNWNRSETIALANSMCTLCHGEGLRPPTRKAATGPCNCVLRGIFRACYNRFRACAAKEKQISRVSLQYFESGKSGGHRTWGRRDEEYMADFCLVTKRVLSEAEHRVFRYHYLLGADWRLCCRQMKIDRGTFFHAIYRIQQKLGRVFRELEPYSLFPLDEYFGGTISKALPGQPSNVVRMPAPKVLRPPLRKIA